ncbi:MAG: hypothetical protein VYD81_03960, partial [Planctomycetota bacterium]|nr:hypothetical protein [Planctomycetota bacterium]
VSARATMARHDLFNKVGTMRKKNFFYGVFAVVLYFAISGAAQAQAGNQPILRGDSNADARVDLSDAIFSLRYLFQGGDAPPCLDALDSNDSGIIDISDPAHILRHLFQGAAAPPAPGMECGEDPTDDQLGCASFPPCEVAGPPDPSEAIAALRASEDGEVDVVVSGAVVTYKRQAVGSAPAGFFLQAGNTGPAIIVELDPTSLDPEPQVGDSISLRATELGTIYDARAIRAVADYEVLESGVDVAAMAQDASDADDLVSGLDGYESELITLSFTLAGEFAGAGGGHSAAVIETNGISGDSNLRLRIPTELLDSLTADNNLVEGCVLTVTGPMWRFRTQAQPSAYALSDISVESCPAPPSPRVTGVVAGSRTGVSVSFDLEIDAASIGDPETAFSFSPALGISSADVQGTTVVLTTEEQAPGTEYTVTVANTVTSPLGAGVDPDANTATFNSLELGLSISSVDYPVIAHGGTVLVTGNGLSGTSEVTIAGEPQSFDVNSDNEVRVFGIVDSTPTGPGALVLSTDSGSASFDLTVIHLVINEVDCDQTSTDSAEFVEVSAGLPGIDLSGYVLVLYNGSNDTSYRRVELNGITNDAGLFVVGPSGFAPEPQTTWGGATNQLQNGADAVGLHQGTADQFPNGTAVNNDLLIDGVVYGTSDRADVAILDIFFGVGNGLAAQLDENLNSSKDTESLQRCGSERLDATTWNVTDPTPGAANTCP